MECCQEETKAEGDAIEWRAKFETLQSITWTRRAHFQIIERPGTTCGAFLFHGARLAAMLRLCIREHKIPQTSQENWPFDEAVMCRILMPFTQSPTVERCSARLMHCGYPDFGTASLRICDLMVGTQDDQKDNMNPRCEMSLENSEIPCGTGRRVRKHQQHQTHQRQNQGATTQMTTQLTRCQTQTPTLSSSGSSGEDQTISDGTTTVDTETA